MTVHKLRIDICDKTKREGANKKNFGEPSTPPHPSPLPPQAWWWGWQQKKGRCDDACNMTFSLRLQESNIHASGLLSISTPHSSSLCLFPDSSVHGPFCSFFYVFVSISQVYLRPNAFKPLHEKSTHSPTSYCNTKPTFSPRLYDHGRLFLRLFLYFLVSWLTTAIHSVLNRQFFFFFILCYSNRISLLLFLKFFLSLSLLCPENQYSPIVHFSFLCTLSVRFRFFSVWSTIIPIHVTIWLAWSSPLLP